MTQITAAWLEERGHLHDVRVLEATIEATTVRVRINDEWFNEHDKVDESFAGTLVIQGAVILEGELSTLNNAWISEVGCHDEVFTFDFCDRERLVVSTNAALWEPASKP